MKCKYKARSTYTLGDKRFKMDIEALKKALREVAMMEEEPDQYYTSRLFPLSQFKIKNPCKQCLVKPMCSKVCEDLIRHKRLGNYLHRIKLKITSLRFLEILYIIFYFIILGTLVFHGCKNELINIKPLIQL